MPKKCTKNVLHHLNWGNANQNYNAISPNNCENGTHHRNCWLHVRKKESFTSGENVNSIQLL